ncbi:MAG TPA: glycosyltransferase [Marisediminicola sp.]|nr:glycosyltransferase [Marisediminicola sp.]
MSIDIMMPFYGSFELFKIAVRSVLQQSDPDWRLTIVDDVYPDLAPGRWAAAIDDDRVTYIRNDENLGISRNYRKCVDLATSDFVVIMGCDDVMLPNYVEQVKRLIADFPDAGVIQPGVRVIDGQGKPALPLADRLKNHYRPSIVTPTSFHGEEIARSLLRGNWTYFPSLCWRTSLVRRHGFRLDLDVVQDLAMLLDIVIGGDTLVLDAVPAFEYRRHTASVSSATAVDGTRFEQERLLFSDATKALRQRGWRRAERTARAHLSSRLNAVTQFPTALRTRDAVGARSLTRHVFANV